MTEQVPTGTCWCGCDEPVGRGAFFVSGHDKRAEAAVVKVVYGSVPDLLAKHDFGPNGTRNAAEELREYQQRGGEYL